MMYIYESILLVMNVSLAFEVPSSNARLSIATDEMPLDKPCHNYHLYSYLQSITPPYVSYLIRTTYTCYTYTNYSPPSPPACLESLHPMHFRFCRR